MDDLVEFLRARLDEDEVVARATAWSASTQIYNAWEAVPPEDEDGDWRIRQKGEVFILTNFDGEEMARHVARHDPARVLREVEAKRRMLDAHSRPHECIELTGSGERSVVDGKPWELWEPQHTEDNGPCFVVRTLAAPYADHPDYRPEWSPSA